MTLEEALKVMSREEVAEACEKRLYIDEIKALEAMYTIADDAVKKQIPLEPNRYSIGQATVFECPICKEMLILPKPFCGNCGHRINWKKVMANSPTKWAED